MARVPRAGGWRRAGWCLALAAVCFAPAGTGAAAQTASGQAAAGASAAKPAQHSGTAASRNRKRTHKAKVEALPAPEPVVAPAPPPPDWPANEKAAPASVEWNGRLLSISATNSSLQQILSDISTATGVKVEGSPADQRIYGVYGPAPARDVLSQLLDGSGYNVLMVGDQGQGAPRTLVLTAKGSAAPAGSGANTPGRPAADEDVEEPEQPEQPDPNFRRPPGLQPLQPGQNRTPQQIMQEIEQRRLEMQQQQGAPVAPQPQPN